MKRFIGFEKGMGIGGWLTNYKRFNVLPDKWRLPLTIGDMEHFASYITERDIEYIASLGMDHVRLGFDQIVLESEPYVYREEIFSHIDNFISWCKKYNLNIVLNMHKAVGNYCDIKEDVKLLDSPELQDRFIALWKEFERRYSDEGGIAFELLNEVRDEPYDKWNALADKTISELRKLNKTRKLIVGSTSWNDPATLKYLNIYDDENVIYTFHTYAPFEFTHQRGVLQPQTLYYNRVMHYPADIDRYRDYRLTVYGEENAYSDFDKMDIEFIKSALKPAVDFAALHPDKILWCGEFGTIRHADLASRENWMRDVISVFKEAGIPYCVWNYLSTHNDGNRFSLVSDDNRKILSENLANIIRGEF